MADVLQESKDNVLEVAKLAHETRPAIAKTFLGTCMRVCCSCLTVEDSKRAVYRHNLGTKGIKTRSFKLVTSYCLP